MEGVTKRVNKKGDTVYEMHLDFIRGFIVGADLKLPPSDHPEYGKTIELKIEAENGAQCVLQIPFDSAYARGFLYSSPNMDLSQPVEIEPYQYFSKKKGRDATGLSLFQNGEKLDWAYGTKDNPGGIPPLKRVKFKGQETWDNSDQLAALEQKYMEFCALFKDVQAEAVPASEPEPQAEAAPAAGDDF